MREARAEEYAAIGELLVAAYAPFLVRDASYAEELRDVAGRAAACTILVAVDPGGRLLGAATYVPGPGPYAETEREGEAGIRMLAVAPDAQGRGIGRSLARACIARARSAGREAIVLLTLTSMVRAHRMYEALGFERCPERDWSPEPGLHLISYRLELRREYGVPCGPLAG